MFCASGDASELVEGKLGFMELGFVVGIEERLEDGEITVFGGGREVFSLVDVVGWWWWWCRCLGRARRRKLLCFKERREI